MITSFGLKIQTCFLLEGNLTSGFGCAAFRPNQDLQDFRIGRTADFVGLSMSANPEKGRDVPEFWLFV